MVTQGGGRSLARREASGPFLSAAAWEVKIAEWIGSIVGFHHQPQPGLLVCSWSGISDGPSRWHFEKGGNYRVQWESLSGSSSRRRMAWVSLSLQRICRCPGPGCTFTSVGRGRPQCRTGTDTHGRSTDAVLLPPPVSPPALRRDLYRLGLLTLHIHGHNSLRRRVSACVSPALAGSGPRQGVARRGDGNFPTTLCVS